MSRTVFFLLVAIAMLSTVFGRSNKCGKNEQWTSCGTACPPKCCEEKPQVCTRQCVKGCQCKSGYLRNSWGKCVLPCDCNCK